MEASSYQSESKPKDTNPNTTIEGERDKDSTAEVDEVNIILSTKQQQAYDEFVKPLYEFAVSENGFCKIPIEGGIEFYKETIDKFKLAFGKKQLDVNGKVIKDANNKALMIDRDLPGGFGVTFKGLQDKLAIYKFHSNTKGRPYFYHHPQFVRDNPRLKAIVSFKRKPNSKHPGSSDQEIDSVIQADTSNALVRQIMSFEQILAKYGPANESLSNNWPKVAKKILKMLDKGINTWAPKLPVSKVLVDYSSPDIGKDMDLLKLRSTVIGDAIASMMEFSDVEVLRRRHVGDSRARAAVLIEFLFNEFPDSENPAEQNIAVLQRSSEEAARRFEVDDEFREGVLEAKKRIEYEDEKYCNARSTICGISREAFGMIYDRLKVVHPLVEGESSYLGHLSMVLSILYEEGIVEHDGEDLVIFIEGKATPLVLARSDDNETYASVDLTALWFRLNAEEVEWIVYVTEAEQSDHFEKFFAAARRAHWISDSENYPKASHVKFARVIENNGMPFQARPGDVMRLLDESKTHGKGLLVTRGKAEEWTAVELENNAEAIGVAAIKYGILKNHHSTEFTFYFHQLLCPEGNTVVYQQDTYARICSIIRESWKAQVVESEDRVGGSMLLGTAEERTLALHILQFTNVVKEACMTLSPFLLCEFLNILSQHFNKFFSAHQADGSGLSVEANKLWLCEATAIVIEKSLNLLGIAITKM